MDGGSYGNQPKAKPEARAPYILGPKPDDERNAEQGSNQALLAGLRQSFADEGKPWMKKKNT